MSDQDKRKLWEPYSITLVAQIWKRNKWASIACVVVATPGQAIDWFTELVKKYRRRKPKMRIVELPFGIPKSIGKTIETSIWTRNKEPKVVNLSTSARPSRIRRTRPTGKAS